MLYITTIPLLLVVAWNSLILLVQKVVLSLMVISFSGRRLQMILFVRCLVLPFNEWIRWNYIHSLKYFPNEYIFAFKCNIQRKYFQFVVVILTSFVCKFSFCQFKLFSSLGSLVFPCLYSTMKFRINFLQCLNNFTFQTY